MDRLGRVEVINMGQAILELFKLRRQGILILHLQNNVASENDYITLISALIAIISTTVSRVYKTISRSEL